MDMATSSSSSDTKSFSGRTPARMPSINMEKGSSSKNKQRPQPQPQQRHQQSQTAAGLQFDMLAWYPKYQSCQRYFVDHAQHDFLVQAFAAFINILLPYQRQPPIYTCRGARSAKERLDEISSLKLGTTPREIADVSVSLIPYIRRLIMHGFFGNDWQQGVGPQRETERRNYLFSAKSGGWANVKRDYDMLPLETVPFLRPLTMPHDEELQQADKSWSEWLAMEDWMVGSRSPDHYPDNAE
ncbi:hypothetical protein LTS08_004976 [Lithohypha guttulata]|nr:hypothetical protein LTS08_004976 [Lithohypha guttulata]